MAKNSCQRHQRRFGRVDLDQRLNELLKKFAGERTGFLFVSNAGGMLSVSTLRSNLQKLGISGFHCFRRYRISRLRENGTPEDIIRYWAGHAGAGITDRYSKLAEMSSYWSKVVGHASRTGLRPSRIRGGPSAAS